MYHLVIDIEMCKVPKHYRTKAYHYANETIQIGAVLLDASYRRVSCICQYVRPMFGVIDNFIRDFTGIRASQVKDEPTLVDALTQLLDWLGDREYDVIAWSDSDYKQLAHEIRAKEILDERIASFMEEGRWIDYQAVFGKRYSYKNAMSLKNALEYCEIDPEGRSHDGLDDAVNTARLYAKLEQDPEYQVHDPYREYMSDSSESFTYSMGDLFAGLMFSA